MITNMLYIMRYSVVLPNGGFDIRYRDHLRLSLISICEDVVREVIVYAANASVGFSILADETADISGEEQLSLGVRFVETTNKKPAVRDEFLGFTSLAQMDAESIVNTLFAQSSD